MKKIIDKIILFLTMTAMIMMLVASSYLIIKHINHHCTGNGCAVCRELEQCFNNIRTLGTAGEIPDRPVTSFVVFVVSLVFAVYVISNKTTLISLKVELLN